MAKVLIGIPVREIYGNVKPKTQACIDHLRAYTKHGTEVRLVRGQQITQNSFTLCRQFLEEGWDYLLYTGDDIVFPPWALDRLLGHDLDFVSGICTWKTPPYFVPAAMLGHDGKFRHVLIRPEHVKNNVLMEVDGTGSGFILLKRAVVQRVWDYLNNEVYPSMPKKHRWLSPIPYFPAVRDPDTGDVLSSDFAFSRLARESGTRIFLDCGLICRHRWEGEYDIEDHWRWIDKYGFAKSEERFYGDEVPFAVVDENSVHWGPAGPPVPITAMTTANHYHLQTHIAPALGCMQEEIMSQDKTRTNVGYAIGWHVVDDVSWQAYSGWAARYAKVLVHWVGSDLMNVNSWLSPERLAHMNNPHFIHLVEDERMLKEAQQYFEKVQVVPLPTVNIFPADPLPEKFAVAVYYPQHRHDFHYGDVLVETIQKMPETQFFLYHLFGQKPDFDLPNAIWLGALAPHEYGELLANTSCMLRMSKHDGRPYSIVEAAIAGRRFVTNFDMPYTNRVPDVPTSDEVVKMLNLLKDMKEPDIKASRYYLKENDLLLFKGRIRKIAGIPEYKNPAQDYDYTAFWEERYGNTDVAGTVNKALDDKVNQYILDAITASQCQSVMDVGCGTANRWEKLPIKDYTGVDISPTAIRKATEKHSEGKFFVADLARDPLPPADMVLALSVLNHIKPMDLDDVLKKLLNIARKRLIAIVATGVKHAGYQFELPPLELLEREGWDLKVHDMDGNGILMVVFTRGKEVANPKRTNNLDPVLQIA